MNKTLNKDNSKPPQDRHGRVSLFAEGWLNNQQGRSKTKQEGTPGWPESPSSIYALPPLDRPSDRASGACGSTEFKGRLLLSDVEMATMAEIAQRLGRKALEELAAVAKPDTVLAWYRKLIANKFDGSRFRQRVGRPRIDEEALSFRSLPRSYPTLHRSVET
jgi:hypothetical protein